MTNRPGRAFRIGSIIWALLIGSGLVALSVSVLLPSTKRARVHFPQPGENEPPSGTVEPASGPVMVSTKRAEVHLWPDQSTRAVATTEPTTRP